jgi:hypothetical protein
MTDLYIRRLLTIIAFAVSVLMIVTISRGPSPVSAQTTKPRQHCVWSYVHDSGAPNIGENGEVATKDKDWQRMSDGGWQLKTASNENYVFERCE